MRNITDTDVPVKLNLGCGDDVKPGYLNIDFRQTHPNVIIADLSTYPWPFADRSASEILMLDFLEHFPYANTPFILLECYRVLDDHGTVVIQVPDARHLTRALIKDGCYLCNQCGSSMWDLSSEQQLDRCVDCGQSAASIAEAAMRRLYGGQDYPGNTHYTCFTDDMLFGKAKAAGLEFVGLEEVEHQWKNWNIKARFKKGSIW